MSKNKPPQKPKPMLDKNGNPIVNQFGFVVSARLTKEDEDQITELAAKGYTRKAICDELGLSDRRVSHFLNKPKTAEAIALMAYTVTIAEHNRKVEELLSGFTDALARMEKRLTDVQSELKMIKAACGRNKIGRETLEREKRSQRKELNQLRKNYWKRTGRKA